MGFFGDFIPEKCVGCGECFHQCPVMELPLEEAQREVGRLAAGSQTRHVLQKCTSCFYCNIICPEKANPTQRIMDVWHEQSLKKGLPIRARYFTPDWPVNFRTYVLSRLPATEQARIRSWEDETPVDEIFYPGCNVITVPHLTRTKLLEGYEIRGSLRLCCGETYYRTGQYELAAQAAKRIQKWQERLGFKKMVIPCTAGMNMFTNVLPKFGLDRKFEVEHLLPVLLKKIESGEIKITHPVNRTFAIQDSCYSKFFGEDYMDTPRRLLEAVGAKVIEMKNCKERMLCCGIGGGFSYHSGYHPWDVTRSTIRSLRQGIQTGADAIAVYCAGCLQMLSVGKLVYPSRVEVFHLLEILQMAIGEKPERHHKLSARLMLQGTALNQFPKVFSPLRFNPQDLISDE